MPPEWHKSVEAKARWIAKQKPKYVLDWRIKPDEALQKGVDCSMYHYLSHHLSGVVGIERVSAADIMAGRGGWAGYNLPARLFGAIGTDLVFWKWIGADGKPTSGKAADHTGILLTDEATGFPAVFHASSGKGTIVSSELTGKLWRDLVAVRHLTIGEPKPK